MAHVQDQKFTELGLQKTISNKKVVSYNRDLEKADGDNPILVLLHGYPQSAYMCENHQSTCSFLTCQMATHSAIAPR